MAILQLDKHTAELIAAGEVVERPASVVKELCENAIDAGAKGIAVDIERGGVTLIRVADDGAGIEARDIPLAFVRHATSKIKTADDLESIHTLGFRGEALASIASVARVELLTKNAADSYATRCLVEGGEQTLTEEAARPGGTTITVRELFYNTPARMKFLKKDASEGTYVTETVTRLALSHPEVAFRYAKDGRAVFSTPGDGKLPSAAWATLGKDFARGLLEVDFNDGALHVGGLVTPPRAGRASRGMQYFFINGRFVKNRTMMAALEQAYRGLSMQGRFPGGLVFLQMPAQLVDVNVHPAKTEVRFAREHDVFDAVYRAVKSALANSFLTREELALGAHGDGRTRTAQDDGIPATAPAAPAATAGRVRAYNHMVTSAAAAADALASTDGYIPYQTAREDAGALPGGLRGGAVLPGFGGHGGGGAGPTEGSEGGMEGELPAAEAPAPVQTAMDAPGAAEPRLRLVGEIFRTYIVAEEGDALCLIDKHAAHERLIYEKVAAGAAAEDTAVQQLLAPVAVALSAAEKDAVINGGPVLRRAGIEVEDFGGTGVLVRGVPANVEPDDVEDLVVEVASRLAVNARDDVNAKTEWVLHSIACRAAVKAGDKTPPGQLLRLAEDILAGRVPPFCPHGRPVVLKLSRGELEKQFGRLG